MKAGVCGGILMLTVNDGRSISVPCIGEPFASFVAGEITSLTRELAEARAEAVRLRSFNTGLDKISYDLERERDEARALAVELATLGDFSAVRPNTETFKIAVRIKRSGTYEQHADEPAEVTVRRMRTEDWPERQ